MKGHWREIQITNINVKATALRWIMVKTVIKWENVLEGEGWCLGSNPSFFFFSCVLVCVSVLFPRIEPVGKPYREVCLRSELWPWMAHQPNSWSKHPGTRIEQVLAYCRDEQKYVGCIELLFCLTVTMTFGVQTWNFIGLMDEIVPIYPPSFTEICSKIREK